MQENTICMKDIIKFVSNNIKVVIDRGDKFHLETTSLYKIIENLSKDKGYEKETIISNFLLCCKYRYIESNTFSNDLSASTSFVKCIVTDVTDIGLQFMNN